MISEAARCQPPTAKRSFTPLHPKSPSLQTGEEWQVKFESTGKPRPLGRGVTGFTLIEVLIALSILAVSLVFLFNLFLMSWQSLAYGRKLNEVSLLAQQKFEELKSLPKEPGEKSGQERDFKWRVLLRTVEAHGGINLTLAQLDIEFNFQGRPQKERFLTYF
ncbi:MAG: prepilin-type N-terminal cleavage/methylation domain-containing protein [Candidatus Omnitrophota bacterium]